MIWALLASLAGLAALALHHAAAAWRWRWREQSLNARLREQSTRREVFEKTLARLRHDYDEGKLTIGEDYHTLFVRLTSETRSGSE